MTVIFSLTSSATKGRVSQRYGYPRSYLLFPPSISSNPRGCRYYCHGLLCSRPREKARLYIFKQPSVQASVAFIDDILMAFGGKRKLRALSWLSRWHLESIKCGLKDPIEAPLIIPSLSRTHTHTHRKHLSLFHIFSASSSSSSDRCILSSKSQMWWRPTSRFASRTGARRRRRCAKDMPTSWCLTNA